jgi:CheY-like chemotaxis protein
MGSPGAGISMGRVLLVCGDPAAVELLAKGTQQLALVTEFSDDVGQALALLKRNKFEAVIIDFGLPRADEMLEQVRLSPANRTAVTFAIAASGSPANFNLQPNFVLEKPFAPGAVERTLKAAFGLIVRERRRSFRCPITIPAAIQSDGEEVSCQLVNISEGGLAIRNSPSLKPGMQVKVIFTLPPQLVCFKIKSEVCWYDEKGHAGLRSLVIPSEQKSILQQWLAGKLEEDLPESVARQFRND